MYHYKKIALIKGKKVLKKVVFGLLMAFITAGANSANIEQIKFALATEFKNKYPQIIIKSIDIQTAALPKNFDEFEFLRLAEGKFDKASGYLRAEFKTPDKLKKNVFFRYFVKARLEVLRANKDLQRGESLGVNNYRMAFFDFDKVPAGALSKDDDLDLVARTNVKKNAILRQNMFKANHLVKKNAALKGVLKDGEVRTSVELNALEAGNKGDTIKVRTRDGKVFQAVVVGKNQVSLE